MKGHGHYQLELQDHKLIFKAYGSWNYATTVNWANECKKLINELQDKPWVCLIDLSEWELVTPDVGEYIHEFNIWLNGKNLKYLAVVYAYVLQKELLMTSHQVLKKIDIKYCKSSEEANIWLANSFKHLNLQSI